ncbi:MAG: hypothetical protein IKH71_03410, partial [Oscillospiraceae bacterium]|nr:hypothetical protein [Oscillospiraceae bacterium]
MSRKIRKVVASTLALAMMTGTAANFPAGQFTAIINAATAEQAVSTSNVAGGLAGPTIDAGTYEVKAGDTFKVKLKATGNTDGFNALNSWLDVDTNVFEIVGKEAGDIDDPENEDSLAYSNVTLNVFKKDGAASGVETLLALYSDTENAKGDQVLATITLKVKDGVKDGYYSLPFDAKGDGGAMANRIDSSRTPIVLNPTFKGAAVTVGTPSDQPTTQPTSQTPATQAPATQTPASQTPASQTPAQSGTLSGKIADASAKAGETVKTSLTISGVNFAGFDTELSFDGLELTKATADGFDVEIQGKKIVGLANPYKDVSSATVNLEFKASKAGSFEVSAASLEAASKDNEKEYKGSVTKGTVTVSDSSSNPTTAPTASTSAPTAQPTSQTPPSSDAIQIEIGKVAGKAGTKVKVPVTAKNIGSGFSALQFDYEIDGGLTVGRGIKGDFGCSWTIGSETKSAQFLEADGMNITKDGVIGKLEVEIPADAKDGTVYKFTISNFEGSAVDSATGKQAKLEGSKFAAIAGSITVGDVPTTEPTEKTTATPTVAPTSTATAQPTEIPTSAPATKAEQPISKTDVAGGIAGPKIDAGTYEVKKAGDTFTLKIKATDNKDGFNALNCWLDVDTTVFDIVSMDAGDTDDPENEDSPAYSNVTLNKFHKDGAADSLTTILALYSDTNNASDDQVIATIVLKVKDGVKDGYYTLPFDAKGDGGAMANRVTTKDGERVPVVLNPTFVGALVTVGTPVSATAEPTESPKPTTTPTATAKPTTTADPTEKPPVGEAITIEIGTVTGAKAGEKVKVPVTAKNVGGGFSALQFDYDID